MEALRLNICRSYACSKSPWRSCRRAWRGPRRSRAAGSRWPRRRRPTAPRRPTATCTTTHRSRARTPSSSSSCQSTGSGSPRSRGSSRRPTTRRAPSPRAASSCRTRSLPNSRISTRGLYILSNAKFLYWVHRECPKSVVEPKLNSGTFFWNWCFTKILENRGELLESKFFDSAFPKIRISCRLISFFTAGGCRKILNMRSLKFNTYYCYKL